MNKTVRKQSISSNESISSMDSRAYSTDKSRSDSSDKPRTSSRNSDIDDNISNQLIDISSNVGLKEGWGFPLKKEKKNFKRRVRDITYKPRRTPTPTINFDYDQFINIDIEEIKK
tara:strand:- start:1627 stop:1971 length:345 start_codon:yes stop_codon:yes gene_type:complete